MTTKTIIRPVTILFIPLLIFIAISCKKSENEDQVPTVITVSVSNVTSTSAVVEGNLISFGDGEVYDYGFFWSNYIDNPVDTDYNLWFGPATITGSFPYQITYLTPGMTYYIRAYAKNIYGTGYGKVLSFTTTGSIVGDIVFNPDLSYGTLTDIEGNTYKTIKIGSQTWMAENLKTTRYNDGTSIAGVTDQNVWKKLSTGAYSWYINQSEPYKNVYGALYNWYVVNTGKLCPKGWHVPSDAEWQSLIKTAEESVFPGRALKETGTAHWQSPDDMATNSTGFTALPSGYRGSEKPFYIIENLGYTGMWWSSTPIDADRVSIYTMGYSFDGVSQQDGYKRAGLACRCLMD